MAIYSLNLGFISRSDGKSSVGFSAYMSGSKALDKRTGQSFNFSHKREVKTARILAPEVAPAWALDRRTLWNRVEAFEDHIATLRFQNEASREKFLNSAQTAQTVMGALPVELTLEQAEACVEEFLRSRFVSRNLVVDYAIHGDRGNPHFHALVTRRALEGDTFSVRKDREIVSKPEHNLTRKSWEVIANKHLEQAGLDVRIDSRSKRDQGSLLIATHHEGWYAQQLADQGNYSRIVTENEEIRQRNIQIITERPEALIQEVALKRTTFTKRHLEEEIIRRVGGDETLFALLKSRLEDLDIKPDLILSPSNDNPVYDAREMRELAGAFVEKVLDDKKTVSLVGENMNRETVYTSQTYKAKEEQVRAYGEALNGKTREVELVEIERSIQRREAELQSPLSDEQKGAIRHLCTGSDLRVLNGRAGTGKTTLLKAVAEVYQKAGYTVWGTSFQGKAVEIMQKEIGISCRTLDSFIYQWKRQDRYTSQIESGKLWGQPYLYAVQKAKDLESSRFTKDHVLIVDEANMIGGHLWAPFLKEAAHKGAKVIVVQDPAQIKSREPGDVGRVLSDRFGAVETNTVVRQRVEWQRESSQYLNEHQLLDGLRPYYDKGHIRWSESKAQAIEALAQAYVKGGGLSSNQMALAFTNEEMRALNKAIRLKLCEQGAFTREHTLNGGIYAVGDKIRFENNDNHGRYIHTLSDGSGRKISPNTPKGIKNGTLGRIEAIDRDKVTVCLEDNRRVQFDARKYKAFSYGYAMTIHKSEGSTFDRVYVTPNRYMNPETSLVAYTRHREGLLIFTDRETFVDFKDMIDTCSRGTFHETLQDYRVTAEQRPPLNRIKQYKDLLNEAITLREEMEGSLDPNEPLYKHPSYEGYQVCFEQKKEVAREILSAWEQHKPFARLAGIRKDVLEVEIGVRERLLSDVEKRAFAQFKEYKHAAHTARDLWERLQETHPGVLAKSHLLYSEYRDQKLKRDRLAHGFSQSPELYRAFFREDSSERKLYWSSLVHQAKDHEKSQSEATYLRSLDKASRSSYKLLQSYCDARNQAAVLYGEIKKQEEASLQITDPDTLRAFKEKQLKRDEFALKVVHQIEACAPHFNRVTFKEDALLQQATNAEVRAYAKDYRLQKGSFLKVESAARLQEALKDRGHYRLVKEDGVELDRLKFDISFGQAVAQGKVSRTQDAEALYDPIKAYLELNREAGRLWKLVKSGQEDLREQAKSAFEARNDNAKELAKSEAALEVLSILRPGFKEGVLHQAKADRVNESLTHSSSRAPAELRRSGRFEKRSAYIRAEQVLEAASYNYRGIVTKLLGKENTRFSKARELRFGNKGSLQFHIAGPKEGRWMDYSSGEGGNLITLVKRELGYDFQGALAYLAQELGVTPESGFKSVPRPQPRETQSQNTQEDELAEQLEKLGAVQALHSKSRDIKGTPGETYLRRVRRINCALSEDIRFIPPGTEFFYVDKTITVYNPTLATFGRDRNGNPFSVQLTRLTNTGEKAVDRDGETYPKHKYGIGKGNFVCLQKSPNATTVFIAEGVETALSIKEAGIEGTILAAQGIHNLKNYKGPESHVVLVSDNDDHKPTSGTPKTIARAKEHFESEGKTVSIIKPDIPGQDFNDVLKCEGVSKVDAYLTPVRITQGSEKLSTLMEDLKAANSPEQRSALEYDLKLIVKEMKQNPDVLAGVKLSANPELKQHIAQTLEKQSERGR